MAKLNLRPLDDRVVVRPLEAEEVTAGGIYLPDAAKEKPQRGKVIAAGPGGHDHGMGGMGGMGGGMGGMGMPGMM